MKTTHLLYLLSLCSFAFGIQPRRPNLPPRPTVPTKHIKRVDRFDKFGNRHPPLNTTYYFDQLIDHDNPSRGTFKQRYWTSYEHYEPGGPVVLITPGEDNAEEFTIYLTNRSVTGAIAQRNNGTAILLEHRFFGLSNPIPDLKDDSLKLLTLDQNTRDLTYFAENIVLSQPNGDNMTADVTPWVLVGGSYSGALTAWTMASHPGVFWAGWSSSGVVEAILDFWRYFEPIQEHMPRNCSADIAAVVAHLDEVVASGTHKEQQSLKEKLGLGELKYMDDVAAALKNLLYTWQDLQTDTGPNGTFYQGCDALEVKHGMSAPPAGWGLEHALTAIGTYFTESLIPAFCENMTIEDCLGSHNASSTIYTNTTIDNADRSWLWCECNEVGWFQESAPKGKTTLVSRVLSPQYDERQCSLFFPTAFPNPPTPRVKETNAKYHGWDVKVDRLFVANGHRDPWREATLSNTQHPRRSTKMQPIHTGNGFHCSDLLFEFGVDPTVKAVSHAGVDTLSQWLSEWPGPKVRKGFTTQDSLTQHGLNLLSAVAEIVMDYLRF